MLPVLINYEGNFLLYNNVTLPSLASQCYHTDHRALRKLDRTPIHSKSLNNCCPIKYQRNCSPSECTNINNKYCI